MLEGLSSVAYRELYTFITSTPNSYPIVVAVILLYNNLFTTMNYLKLVMIWFF